jgi:hypothetical protein
VHRTEGKSARDENCVEEKCRAFSKFAQAPQSHKKAVEIETHFVGAYTVDKRLIIYSYKPIEATKSNITHISPNERAQGHSDLSTGNATRDTRNLSNPAVTNKP